VIFTIQTDAEELNTCSYGFCCINNYACRKFDALFCIVLRELVTDLVIRLSTGKEAESCFLFLPIVANLEKLAVEN
jgi:hypothetical protein